MKLFTDVSTFFDAKTADRGVNFCIASKSPHRMPHMLFNLFFCAEENIFPSSLSS